MRIDLNSIILYVQDVDRLATFYRHAFALSVVEEIKGDCAVLNVGPCQLALHKSVRRTVSPIHLPCRSRAMRSWS